MVGERQHAGGLGSLLHTRSTLIQPLHHDFGSLNRISDIRQRRHQLVHIRNLLPQHFAFGIQA